MGAIEASAGAQNKMATEDRLAHHWMLDSVAASELSSGVSLEGHDYIRELSAGIKTVPEAVPARDKHRQEIAAIFRGESDMQLVVIGPCSLDTETDYEELFDYIGGLQEEHPGTLVAMRANGSKPRTDGKWGGIIRSIDPAEQEKTIDIYGQAFERAIPILTEITDRDEFGVLAPYLSAAWIGARDMESTALRSLVTATRLPFAVKNGTDGQPGTVANAVIAMRKNSADSEGSGVNLGMLAYTYRPNSVGLPAMLEVGEGNPNVAIIARGYELPQTMPIEEKAREAVNHLGKMCAVAAELECTVLVDGSHGLPPMFGIDRKQADRFPRVVTEAQEAVRRGEIPHADRLRGYVGEISTSHGRTDKNWLLSEASRPDDGLGSIIRQPVAVG